MASKKIKKLYRSRKNRIIAGVCGGIAEYFEVDPTIVRIIYVLLTVLTAFIPLVIVYLASWVLIPER